MAGILVRYRKEVLISNNKPDHSKIEFPPYFRISCVQGIFLKRIVLKYSERGRFLWKKIVLPHDHGQRIEKELEHMPKEEDFQTVSEIFKQLCDGSRIRIFWLLCHCEECVINLASLVGMTSPAVSHHLRQLKSSGLIVSRRDGKRSLLQSRRHGAGTASPSNDRKNGRNILSFFGIILAEEVTHERSI